MLILGDMSRDTKSIVSVSQSTEQAFSISYAGDHTVQPWSWSLNTMPTLKENYFKCSMHPEK